MEPLDVLGAMKSASDKFFCPAGIVSCCLSRLNRASSPARSDPAYTTMSSSSLAAGQKP
jgi:hypothetical protein